MGIDGGGRDRGTEKPTGKEPMDEMKDGKWCPMKSSTTLVMVT